MPGPRSAGHVLCGQHGADRRAAGEGLGQGHDVRLDSFLLIGQEAAGSAAADLDFIEDQQQIVLIAELPYRLEIAGRRYVDAPFTLDRFEHDGAGVGA